MKNEVIVLICIRNTHTEERKKEERRRKKVRRTTDSIGNTQKGNRNLQE